MLRTEYKRPAGEGDGQAFEEMIAVAALAL